MVTIVIPQNPETQNLPIIVQILLQPLVRPASVQLNFKILFSFSQIRRILLHLNHSSCVLKRIFRSFNIICKRNPFILEEASCERIARQDLEHSSVEFNFSANLEITPVELSSFCWMRCLVSLEEYSLRDSRVLNFGLHDMYCVIFQVVVDHTLSNPVVLIWVFHDRLLEEANKLQDLSIVLQPGRLLRNSFILSWLPLWNTRQTQRLPCPHLLEKAFVNIFLNELRLLYG